MFCIGRTIVVDGTLLCCRVQANFRGYIVRKNVAEMWEGFLRLQAAWRATLYRQVWVKRRAAVFTIQRIAKVCSRALT